MIIVTGGAGFIGSNLVRHLVSAGRRVIVVDNLAEREKFETNLGGCDVTDCIDKNDFLSLLRRSRSLGRISGILHQGACADTTCRDAALVRRDNFDYSVAVSNWAVNNGVPFVYASSAAVYGSSRICVEEPQYEQPLNLYARSKLLFDRYVRRHFSGIDSTVVGLRYFNVYGPGESCKGRMASTAWQLWRQLLQMGEARLFEGSDGYAAGEQRRDFVHVSDIVKVNMHFLTGPAMCGIFNVGTGQARSFNDLARTLIRHADRGNIRYITFPEALRGSYQSFTQANLLALRGQGGYEADFLSLEDGITRSAASWGQ